MRWIIALALALLIPGLATAQSVSSAASVDANGFYADPYLTIEPAAHYGATKSISVDSNGRFVVTGSDDKTVRVWSASDGRLLQTLRIPSGPNDIGKVYAVAISPDGKKIAVGGYTGKFSGAQNIYIFDRVTGMITYRFANLAQQVNTLKFSSNGKQLVAGLNANGGLHLFDIISRKEIGKDQNYEKGIIGLDFASDGRVIATGTDGYIRLYSSKLSLIKKIADPHGKIPVDIAFSPDEKKIAVGHNFSQHIDIFDSNSLKFLYFAGTVTVSKQGLPTVSWTADGNQLIAGGNITDAQYNSIIRVWEQAGRGSFRDVPIARSSIYKIQSISDGRTTVATYDPKVIMLDKMAAPVWAINAPRLYFAGASLNLSHDGFVAQLAPFSSPPVQKFDVRRRFLSANPPADNALLPAKTTGLDIADWRGSNSPMLSGKRLTLDEFEYSNAVSVAPDNSSFLMGTRFFLRRFRSDGSLIWTGNTPGETWAVNQSTDGKLAVAVYHDGTIRWYNLADGVEQLALFVHADGERWVAWTPKGYYTASPGGEDLIRWVVNRGLDVAPQEYPVGAYRDKFYRPDVIATVLDTLDINRAVQLADAARGRPSVAVSAAVVVQQAPPVVTILDPADGASVRNSPIEVAYRISGKPGERINRLRALIDNREAVSQRDLTIPASGTLDGTIKVPVEGIAPLLQLYAANEFADSAPATRKLSGGIARQDANKPVLYVLAIGISEYRNDARLKLNFADDDARAFVERMRAQKGGLYRDVVVRQLIDRDATTYAIRESLSWLQREMTGADVATVFVSAHGETDGRGDLYLISNDTDVRDHITMRQTAMQWNDFKKDIEDLASRGKVLVFLDACKSGRVIPGKSVFPPDIDKAVNELRESGNDVTIFSSSTGTQLSREDEKLGQGYFTYALLEALDGKGHRSDGYVTTGDLNRYIAERVKKLTEGAQTPKVSTPLGTTSNPPLFVIR